MLAQETPVPLKPALHSHVKASVPGVASLVHAALPCTQRAHQEPPLVSSAAVTRWFNKVSETWVGGERQRVILVQRLPPFHLYRWTRTDANTCSRKQPKAHAFGVLKTQLAPES